MVQLETGRWSRVLPTRIWGQVHTWYLSNPDLGQALRLLAKAPSTEAIPGESLSPGVTAPMTPDENLSTDEFCPGTNAPKGLRLRRRGGVWLLDGVNRRLEATNMT